MAHSFSSVREEFPILKARGITYLDSAASAQKPQVVCDSIDYAYKRSYANVHRGVYGLSIEATELYEGSRDIVQQFINAKSRREIVFTRGATESINLVAYSWGENNINEGDEVVVTICEHHSNFVPWQMLCKRKRAVLKVVYLESNEDFSLEKLRREVSSKTRLIAVTALANAIGLKLPVDEIVKLGHSHGAKILIDAAQALPHVNIDVQETGCDFLVSSGHKIYGPSGVGFLYAKEEILQAMPPFLFGGDMISSVGVEETLWNELPYKFEAGTPNIVGVIGLGAAIKFVSDIGLSEIAAHEQKLIRLLEANLAKIPGLKILGPLGQHHGLVCFVMDNIHPHDLAQYLDHKKICIRAGHHCAQPLLNWLGYNASARISVGVYNNEDDIERTVDAIKRAREFFS